MLRELVKKLIYGYKCDSESYISYLRKKGAKIGNRTRVFAPNKTIIDMTRPWLIDIGDDVQITEGVTILTHGYDWSVIKGVYGEVLGSSGGVSIGNNVFIGMHTTILKGTHIGNNVIIGANSLVNKDIPDNVVAGGNPCKVLMSLEDYYKKRKDAQVEEATELVRKYEETYGKNPSEEELCEFFWLFCNDERDLTDAWDKKMKLVGNYKFSIQKLKQNKKAYDNMNCFLHEIGL